MNPRLGLSMDDKIILFFGFVRPYKGLDLLLEAMAFPQLRKQNIHLLVAGEFYGDETSYRNQVKELGLSGNVTFYSSYIAKEDVKNFFCSADLIVQPYKNATQSGITQIAYHFERPMLVTDVGGLSEIVSDGRVGYVVPARPSEIAERINEFYVLGKEDEFSRAASVEKQRFSWKTFAGVIMKMASMK